MNIQSPLTGNQISSRWYVLRHKCWRDRVPWYGRRHLAALIREAGL